MGYLKMNRKRKTFSPFFFFLILSYVVSFFLFHATFYFPAPWTKLVFIASLFLYPSFYFPYTFIQAFLDLYQKKDGSVLRFQILSFFSLIFFVFLFFSVFSEKFLFTSKSLLIILFSLPFLFLCFFIKINSSLTSFFQSIFSISAKIDSVCNKEHELPLSPVQEKDLQNLIIRCNNMLNKLEYFKIISVSNLKAELWDEVYKKISHEFRNPLTPLKLSAERILSKSGKDNFESAATKSANIILTQIQIIEKKITDFSKCMENTELKNSPTNLKILVENCCKKLYYVYPDFTIHIRKKDDFLIYNDPYFFEFFIYIAIEFYINTYPHNTSSNLDIDMTPHQITFILWPEKSQCEMINLCCSSLTINNTETIKKIFTSYHGKISIEEEAEKISIQLPNLFYK